MTFSEEKDKAVHDDISQVLYSESELSARVAQMGQQIASDYSSKIAEDDRLVFLCILRGAAIFAADLARAVKIPVEMDYMCVSSYGDAATSSGMVRIQKEPSCDIAGRHVIIVEDIIDTGLTLNYLRKNLAARGPASVEIAALLQKQREEQCSVEPRYLGFTCPDEFIVGYGLDFAERYRNLPYIGILNPEVYQ